MRAMLFLCLTIALHAGPVDARFIRPDLEKIPVERLVKNLEMLAGKNPKDVAVQFNLARVHAMAYAQKTDQIEVWKNKLDQGAWFGYTPAFVPFKIVTTKDEERIQAAKDHLEKAIASYQAALKLDKGHYASQLGLAWLLDQSGKKEDAVKAYREVIDNAWKKEKDKQNAPLGGHFITSEAAGYLIPLLDRENDKAEIKTLQDRTAKLNRLPRPITPIAIPLRAGLTATDLEDHRASVAFDADGTGLSRKWTWITRDAGWLVYDHHGKGQITSALQMFGSVSFWTFWDNGYEALRTLDDDGDGFLRGKELAGLALWVDTNGNGICEAGEVRPLSAYGIVALSCACERDPSHVDRIFFAPRGAMFRDGTTRPTFDLILKSR